MSAGLTPIFTLAAPLFTVIRARIKDEDDTFVPFTKDDYVSYILTSSLLLLHVYYLDSTFHLFNVYLITILVRNIKNPTNTRLHKGER